MASNDVLKEIDTKSCIFCFCDHIMRVGNIDFNNILFEKKSCQNTFIYVIWCKTFIYAKPLRICSIKWINVSKFKIGLNIKYSLILKDMT